MLTKLKNNKKAQYLWEKIQQPHVIVISIIIFIVVVNIFSDEWYQRNSPLVMKELKEDGEHCVRPLKKVIVNTPELEIVQLKSLYTKSLVAASFKVQNTSNNLVVIDAEPLKDLLLGEHTLLAELTKEELKPSETCKFYIVYRKLSTLRDLWVFSPEGTDPYVPPVKESEKFRFK
ncbi:MAG: hypothetical protein HRU35_01570 [Rickettsiaceae bacterium]|nr:hypothetical protein [Rickettsiaceae bacterium]